MKKPSSIEAARRVYELERRVLMMCCEAVSTARSQAVYMMASAELWDDYLRLDVPDFDSPTFADDYLVTTMMSKHPGLPNTSYDKRHIAEEKWLEAEDACRAMNQRWICPEEKLACDKLVVDTQSIIRSILGELTSSDLSFVESHARFGPGATSSVSGMDVVLSRKMTSHWDVTPGLLPFYRSLVPFSEGYRAPSGRIIDHNKVTFVPKNSKTERAIAIEPHANIFAQLGVGALIRQRLLRIGIDLSNQKFKNRARVLSDRACSTIDLASASDTVAYRTVLNLLPIEWVHLLDICRCPSSLFRDEVVHLQKFSSMGNGYTFELETLIFYAISLAAGARNVDVFGDDIIVESSSGESVVSALKHLGFKVNADKTFLAGRFFESCGIDVHNGVNVRPFFLKGKYETFDHACIRIANAIRSYAHTRNHGNGCDRRFFFAWLGCIKRSNIARKSYAPYPYDNGVWRDFDECCPTLDKRGWDAYVGKVYSGTPVRSFRSVTRGKYLASLAFGSKEVSRDTEYQRSPTREHRIRFQSFPGPWTNLGSWR